MNESRLPSGRLLIPAAALLWGLQFAFLNPSIGLLLAQLYDASAAQVGWALAAYNVSGFVSTLIVPTRADRKGDYIKPMIGCGVLTVLLVTALALATTLPAAVLALVALGGPAGVGIGLVFAHQRATGATVREQMRTRAMFSFAWVAGPPLATVLLGTFGERSVLWAIALVACVCIAVTFQLHRATPKPKAAPPAENDSMLAAVRSPRVLLLLAAFVLLYAANNASVSVTTLFVTQRLDLDVLWGGAALALAAACEIPALLALGRMSERIDTTRLLVAGGLSGVGYYTVMVLATGPVLLLASQVLNALCIAAISGIGLTIFQDVVPKPGLASGLFMNTYRVGAIVAGPLIATGGMTSLGYATVFLACAATTFLGVLLVLLSTRHARSGA